MVDLGPYVEQMARRYIRAYARWACNGTKGRGKLDSVYVGITERRDGPGAAQWKNYSSCGDLSQDICFHMGVRRPWVNRAGYQGWRSGRMLADFYTRVGGEPPPAVEPAPDYVPGAGDICFIWSDSAADAHTLTCGDLTGYAPSLTADVTQGRYTKVETFNYGAGGMSPVEFPGARQVDGAMNVRHSEPLPGNPGMFKHVLHPVGLPPIEGAHVEPGLWLGQRKIRYVLTVPALLAMIETEDLPTMTNETIAALEARVP